MDNEGELKAIITTTIKNVINVITPEWQRFQAKRTKFHEALTEASHLAVKEQIEINKSIIARTDVQKLRIMHGKDHKVTDGSLLSTPLAVRRKE